MNEQNVTALIAVISSILAGVLGKYGLNSDQLAALLTSIVGIIGSVLVHHSADTAKQIAVAQAVASQPPTPPKAS